MAFGSQWTCYCFSFSHKHTCDLREEALNNRNDENTGLCVCMVNMVIIFKHCCVILSVCHWNQQLKPKINYWRRKAWWEDSRPFMLILSLHAWLVLAVCHPGNGWDLWMGFFKHKGCLTGLTCIMSLVLILLSVVCLFVLINKYKIWLATWELVFCKNKFNNLLFNVKFTACTQDTIHLHGHKSH